MAETEIKQRGVALAYLWRHLKPAQQSSILKENYQARIWYAAWTAREKDSG